MYTLDALLTGSFAATQDNDAANQLVLDRQYYSPEWRLTSAFNASLNTSLLTAFAELEEVEVDGFVFRRKRSVSVAATSQRGRESAAHQASSKRRRTSTAGALSGGWVAERVHREGVPARAMSCPGDTCYSSSGCARWCIRPATSLAAPPPRQVGERVLRVAMVSATAELMPCPGV